MHTDNIVTSNHIKQSLAILAQGILFILTLAWFVCCWVPSMPLF